MTTTKSKAAPTQAKGARPSSGRRAAGDAPQTRLNVNINAQTAAALKDYAEEQGVSITEAVRRLIGVGDFIAKAQGEGKQVLLRQDGETERVVFSY